MRCRLVAADGKLQKLFLLLVEFIIAVVMLTPNMEFPQQKEETWWKYTSGDVRKWLEFVEVNDGWMSINGRLLRKLIVFWNFSQFKWRCRRMTPFDMIPLVPIHHEIEICIEMFLNSPFRCWFLHENNFRRANWFQISITVTIKSFYGPPNCGTCDKVLIDSPQHYRTPFGAFRCSGVMDCYLSLFAMA